MALIKCYECEREINDKTPACPHCGAPKEEQPPQIEEAEIPASVAVADEPDAMIDRLEEGGDLDLSHLTTAEGFKLPERIRGDLDLRGLTTAEGFNNPNGATNEENVRRSCDGRRPDYGGGVEAAGGYRGS